MINILTPSIHTVAIVGGGFSGTLIAVNMLRHSSTERFKIILIEQASRIGRGLAYGTWNDNFVLNVPAGNMSALVDEPNNFVEYCQSIDPAFNAGSFISRRIYGDYLEFTLQQAKISGNGTSLQRLKGKVIAVRRQLDQSNFLINLESGESIHADQVILALGHFAPLDTTLGAELYGDQAYIENPWDARALERVQGDAPVALLGAGHTAVDVLFRLTSHSDTKKVYIVSRRGLSLQPHRSHPHSPSVGQFPPFLEGLPATIRCYFHALRQEIKSKAEKGIDWRDVMNGLRPYTSIIWSRLSKKEKLRFVSQVVAYWDIHRHRLAPAAYLRLKEMQRSGQVEMVAGYVQGYQSDNGFVSIKLRERHTGHIRQLSVKNIINCTGPSYDIFKIQEPLIAQLRDEGYLQQDAIRLGIEIDDSYQPIKPSGGSVENMFYIGPMLKARYWEAIAVPELRMHTYRLAKIVLNKIISTN